MERTKRVFGALLLVLFVSSTAALAQTPPASQTVGGVTKQEKDINKDRKLENTVRSPKTKPIEAQSNEIAKPETGPKVKIEKVVVEGATLLTPSEIAEITGKYEGKELSMAGLKKVADLITDEYRKKGYMTSRAYVPPQTVKDATLVIKVVEGKIGKIEIQGNKNYSTKTLKRKFEARPNGYFDFSALQRSLVYINESPDRKAKATLVPGQEPGTTDVIVNVEDRLPIHVGFEYDNYASRYVDRNRFSGTLEHNNLLGFDDKLFLKYQRGESSRLVLTQGRYVVPVTPTLDLGVYALTTKLRLGKEFQLIDARGEAEIYGVFFSQILFGTSDLDVRWNGGFDYKKITNSIAGGESSRDALRIVRTGFDIDYTDAWGRNILTPEIQQGIPGIFGGMRKKDPYSSRAASGSGGEFTKGLLSYYRLQRMPYETTLLWKNNGQYTNNVMTASEEFQIGGPSSVRGYPVGEFAGDVGFYTSPELSFPIYFLPKDLTVPGNRETLYDTSRLVLFYDWGTVQLNSSLSGEKKKQTLRGWGYGYRFNLRDNVSFRVEVGYPLGHKTPSDAKHAHPWVEVILKY